MEIIIFLLVCAVIAGVITGNAKKKMKLRGGHRGHRRARHDGGVYVGDGGSHDWGSHHHGGSDHGGWGGSDSGSSGGGDSGGGGGDGGGGGGD